MGRDRLHPCGWPGCDQKLPAWRAFCYRHFGRLPAVHKDKLTRLKHWWPEAKRARAAAKRWAAKQEQPKEK